MSDSDNLEQIGRAMMLAWGRIKKAQARMWGDWMTIGEGLLEGRRWAMQQAGGLNRPEGKGYVVAFAEWLKRFRVDDMDKSDRAKLLQLMEERPGVEEWRATLTDHERRNFNNPTIVWRKWTAATRVKKPKPRTAGASASEMGRARATVEQLQARVEELEQEVEAARSGDTELLDDACMALHGCFKVLGSTAANIETLMSERLFAFWQERERRQYAQAGEPEVGETDDDEEPTQAANSELLWTGDEDDGYLGRGLAEGKYLVAYTVVPVTFRGCEGFEAKIITDLNSDPDLTLPVKQLADRHGMRLTHDVKGKRRRLDPLPTAAEAKARCEAAYAQE